MDEKGATHLSDIATKALAEPNRPASALPMYLLMVSGGIPGAMLRLAAGDTRIGRAIENTYALNEASVSRHHASITIDGQGIVWLADLASVNGTFLNGHRLLPNTPVRLEDGAKVQIGASIVVKFVCLDPSEERFQREIFERIVRDDLTGLYNRAYFLNQIEALAASATARGLGLSVLLLDLDHFKRVNDTHGHAAGDAVLREVAQALRGSTRPDDLVARYGGEEFILALPVRAPDQATERAERIRSDLAERRIVTDRAIVKITASLGVAFAEAGSFRSADELIAIADHALYQAKRNGRDRVAFRHDAPVGTVHVSGIQPE